MEKLKDKGPQRMTKMKEKFHKLINFEKGPGDYLKVDDLIFVKILVANLYETIQY